MNSQRLLIRIHGEEVLEEFSSPIGAVHLGNAKEFHRLSMDFHAFWINFWPISVNSHPFRMISDPRASDPMRPGCQDGRRTAQFRGGPQQFGAGQPQ